MHPNLVVHLISARVPLISAHCQAILFPGDSPFDPALAIAHTDIHVPVTGPALTGRIHTHWTAIHTPLVAPHKCRTPRFTNASFRPLSGLTNGHSLSRLMTTQGLQLLAAQDVPTHRRKAHKHLDSKHLPLPRMLFAHSYAMIPTICNATDSGEHSVHLTTHEVHLGIACVK